MKIKETFIVWEDSSMTWTKMYQCIDRKISQRWFLEVNGSIEEIEWARATYLQHQEPR